MGKQFEYTTCEVNQARHTTYFNDCGLTSFKPKNLAPDKIFLDEYDASEFLCDSLDNYVVGYVTFATTPKSVFTNAKVKKLEARAIKKAQLWWAHMADATEKASKMNSRKCPSCDKINYMKAFTRAFRHYQQTPNWLRAYGFSMGCAHCNEKSLPLTRAQASKGYKLRGDMTALKIEMQTAIEAELIKQHKKGKVMTKEIVGAWVHEIDARQFENDY